ncbi:MAG TPA: TPM domain-containing protein [Paludibacteraceae bacterium]|nr:TPM domain-containing protein [Paludibacteraceae bacterium]HQF50844.1 TPM domain-containing protein [Paludibacteraceae bacterium]HQJ89857.1 TPM domain-containing protein [Paludibacteraceae bacterium]
MKRHTLIILFLWFSAFRLFAGIYNIDNIEMVHLADSNKYVCNPDFILNPDSVAVIDEILHHLELNTGIETVVVVAESVEPDCLNFAVNLGNKYGVGKKYKDNGLVIVLSTKDRCIQFATGKGLEGDLPDIICKRIQIDYMNEQFAEGKWEEGMTNGIRALYNHLDGSEIIEEQANDFPMASFIILIILILLRVFGITSKGSRSVGSRGRGSGFGGGSFGGGGGGSRF